MKFPFHSGPLSHSSLCYGAVKAVCFGVSFTKILGICKHTNTSFCTQMIIDVIYTVLDLALFINVVQMFYIKT